MDLIIDSAENPLYGKKWWAESDEPWQTLACCMEIADVVKSGQDPALYMSHFPVHQVCVLLCHFGNVNFLN